MKACRVMETSYEGIAPCWVVVSTVLMVAQPASRAAEKSAMAALWRLSIFNVKSEEDFII